MAQFWISGGAILQDESGAVYCCDNCPCTPCDCCDTSDPFPEVSLQFPSSFSDVTYAGVAAALNGQTFILSSSGSCVYDYTNFGDNADWWIEISVFLGFVGTGAGSGDCYVDNIIINIFATDPSSTEDCPDGIAQVNIQNVSTINYENCGGAIVDADLTPIYDLESDCKVVEFADPLGNFTLSI